MASSKVQGSKLARDRQAALLALADSIGDAKAAARFGIRSSTTVRNYRRSLAKDGELRALYEAAKARQDAMDDRVVEAEASAIVSVWGAVRHTADLLRATDKPASPQHLEALARVIEAAGKNADNRSELELTRKMLEGNQSSGQRAAENPAHPASGRSPAAAGPEHAPVH